MTRKPTIVQVRDLSLVVVRADRDWEPEIEAAWRALESKLDSLKGRKYYGVCQNDKGGSVYYAGLEPLSREEAQQLGLPTLFLRGGTYARVKLSDWPRHTDRIGSIFEELEKSLSTDPARPVLEYYRSHSELHLLAPLAEN